MTAASPAQRIRPESQSPLLPFKQLRLLRSPSLQLTALFFRRFRAMVRIPRVHVALLLIASAVCSAAPEALAQTVQQRNTAGTGKAAPAKAKAVAPVKTAPKAPPKAANKTGSALKRVAAVAPLAVRDGDAEARLIDIYRLIGQARQREALEKAETLVKDNPNFQLAQLVYGDLLAGRTRPVRTLGDVPDTTAQAAAPQLAELRQESLQRLRALRERPAPGMLPSQFLTLSPRVKHAIAVDTSRSRLYLFENSADGLKLLADYYISVGKSGIEKNLEGDLRTPLGVYFVIGNLDPKSLKDFYGAGPWSDPNGGGSSPSQLSMPQSSTHASGLKRRACKSSGFLSGRTGS